MKRTPLTRNTPLKRTRMKRKRRKGDKPSVRMKYLQEHSCCAVCGEGWRTFDNWLEVHHIVGAAGRKDCLENLLTLCRFCHDKYHRGHELTPGMLLWAKQQSDPAHYDERVICELLGRKALPENWIPIPPPAWVYQERERSMR